MKLRDNYTKLANFLGSWFPDADLEGLDDSEVILEFLRTPNKEEHESVYLELESLLGAPGPMPWKEVGEEANRHFEGEAECRQWLRDRLVELRSK